MTAPRASGADVAGDASRRRVVRLTVLLVALSAPALLAPWVGGSVTGLVRVIDPDNAYLSFARPLLLYGALPLSVMSAVVLVMGPGLLFALALGRARDLWSWLVSGFVLSFLSVSVLAAAVQAVAGRPATGVLFAIPVMGLTAIAGAVAATRPGGADAAYPLSDRSARRALAWLLVAPAVLLVLLTPKLFWESLNGDGAHAFWSTRLLLSGPLPLFPPEAGLISAWPGVGGLTYPFVPSWFMRLFGEVEAAVRLPIILLLPLLHASMVQVVEVAGGRPAGGRAQLLIGGSLLGFALILTYSATYEPYMADVSMPGVLDVLAVLFAFAAFTAFARGERGWLILLVLLGLMTSPAALTMMGFLLAASFIVTRPLPWKRTLAYGLGLLGCMGLLGAAPFLLEALGFPPPGDEFGTIGLLRENYSVLSYASFERFGYVILACGVYPIACFAGWRRADPLTRALMLVALAQFGMYFVMGAAALHYFVPAMLIPVIAFWRLHDADGLKVAPFVACCAGVVASTILALPRSTAIHVATREVGEQIEVVGFDIDDPAALDASTRLRELFGVLANPAVPDETYSGPPVGWLYYALHTRDPRTEPVYGLVRAGRSPSRPGERIAADDLAEVWVYDAEEWDARRASRPRDSLGRSLFVVPRDKLFAGRAAGLPGAFRTGAILERILGSDGR